MELVVNGGFPEWRLKRQCSEDGEYGSSDVTIKYKRPKVFATRDFPNGCGRSNEVVVCLGSTENLVGKGKNGASEVDSVEPSENVESQASEVLGEFDESELVGAAYGFGSETVEMMMVSSDDEDKELEMVAKVEPVGIELLKPLDNAGFVDPLGTLEHEATELSKEALVEALPKIYPPRIRISATRDFPPGCGSSTPHVRENCLQGIGYKGLGHEKAVAGHKPFEEPVGNDVKQDKDEVQGEDESTRKLNGMFSVETSDNVQVQSKGDGSQLVTSVIKSEREDTKGKSIQPSCNSNLSQPDRKSQEIIKNHKKDGGWEEKQGMEIVNNMEVENGSLNRKVSGVNGNMNKLQGKKPIGSQVGRVIVQALMAAPNCPWRQNKRTFKSNSTSRITRGKGKKH